MNYSELREQAQACSRVSTQSPSRHFWNATAAYWRKREELKPALGEHRAADVATFYAGEFLK